MDNLKKGIEVKGLSVDKEPVLVKGTIVSVLERTVVVYTKEFGNVIMKKSDLSLIESF